MNLIFNSTEGFESDLREFDEVTRCKVTERVNQVAQEFIQDKRAFARHARKPCTIQLGNGYESSLYSVKVEPSVRVLLTVDDDPIFERVIVTLMRVVKRAQSRKAYDSIVEALYKHLNGCKVGEGVPIG